MHALAQRLIDAKVGLESPDLLEQSMLASFPKETLKEARESLAKTLLSLHPDADDSQFWQLIELITKALPSAASINQIKK